MKATQERRLIPFIGFLNGLVEELNGLSDEGWALLVEGPRDANAMKSLGYRGLIVTTSSLSRFGTKSLGDAKGVVVLTDLDREGRQLASRYTRILLHGGFQTSLLQRKRLLVASKGVFRHIENLSRFADLLAS